MGLDWGRPGRGRGRACVNREYQLFVALEFFLSLASTFSLVNRVFVVVVVVRGK